MWRKKSDLLTSDSRRLRRAPTTMSDSEGDGRERQESARTVALLHCYVKRLAAPLFYLQILSLIIKPPHIFCMRPSPALLPVKSIKKPLDCSSTPSHLFFPAHARARTNTHTHTHKTLSAPCEFTRLQNGPQDYIAYLYIDAFFIKADNATLPLSSTSRRD